MSQIISDRLIRVSCDVEEYLSLKDLENRKLYLSSEINALDCEESCNQHLSRTVISLNKSLTLMNRTKILGLTSGYRSGFLSTRQAVTSQKAFSLVSAIELSKTPIHTINIGIWASMAFWIGITGHKRFALPYTEFLLHEGKLFTVGSAGSVQDTVDFDKRYKEEVIKKHVLKHSTMGNAEYEATLRRENYMLPEDALKYGFIDKIITDINTIL